MKRFLVLLTVLLAMLSWHGLALATAQEGDRIMVDGESRFLQTEPLAPHLKRIEWRPPEKAAISSANWRGYLAHWAIEDERLVLQDVTMRMHGEEPREITTVSILGSLFPDDSRVVATWYSGALVIPEGKVINYQHLGYGSTFERYQVFRITDGVVTEHRRLTGAEFEDYKKQKWDNYRKTDHYREAYEDLRSSQDDWSEALIEEFLMGYYAEHYLNM